MTVLPVICSLPFGWQRSSFMLPPAPPSPSQPFQLVLTVLLLLLPHMSWCQTKAAEDHLISELVHSIEKASVFFDEYQNNINVDGLFGIQVGQGQLLSIDKLLSKIHADEKLKEKIQQIIARMEVVIKLINNRNQKSMTSYSQRFKQLVTEPMEIPWVPRWLVDNQKPISFEKLQVYNEEFGDTCLARVLGSYVPEDEDQLPKCNVTKECLDFMTKQNTTGYYLSHQLLYFNCIQMNDCAGRAGFEEFQERPTVVDIQRQLCGKMYNEAKQLAIHGYVDLSFQDLFAEHNFLCAPLGFQNFLHADWIKMVISWQSPIGCFAETTVDNTLYSTRSSPTMRKLMREELMPNGCLSHKSGLCYGVLTTYLNGILRRQLYHS
ncbi:UPF0764 protein C16orf89 homolog [Octopus sinensis]|uniref:UPF0764 protein C16orf89 homolog n=1 Tax=Octopus sinensis TaxID=2607531 RepID=A0A6P7TIY2_9MOLL|nr:UPF0764 protein C16orf89 homolog [Octopus sinensis]